MRHVLALAQMRTSRKFSAQTQIAGQNQSVIMLDIMGGIKQREATVGYQKTVLSLRSLKPFASCRS